MNVRCQLGLGDAVYAFPIVKELAKKSHVKVLTKYPEVFKDLSNMSCVDEMDSYDIYLKYTREPGLNQYDEMCRRARIRPAFKFTYKSDNVESMKALGQGKSICVVKEPCAAHMNKQKGNFSASPKVGEFQEWINLNASKYHYISVGKSEVFKKRLSGIDLDLNDVLTVSQLLQLCVAADAFATQIGHLVPIAQGLGKPLKIFPPEKITDHRLENLTIDKVRIPEIKNETI